MIFVNFCVGKTVGGQPPGASGLFVTDSLVNFAAMESTEWFQTSKILNLNGTMKIIQLYVLMC